MKMLRRGFGWSCRPPGATRVYPGRTGLLLVPTAAVLIIALSGCATLDAKVAVPVSCLKSDPPSVPQTATEAEILAMSEYAATLTIYTERLLLKAYSAKADALLQACR